MTDSAEYTADAVIVAAGADAKWLGLESETRLRGKGVSSCATCDGAFFRDKKVFVVGGGDSAMEEATFLTKFASSVTILVRGAKEDLKASKIMQERAMENDKIEFMFHTEVTEVLGENNVTGLKLMNNQTNEETEAEADGLFVAIGHKPNTEIFTGSLDMNEIGYLEKQPHTTQSNIEGVFIAGDVHDHRYRQAVSAAGFGCMAALDAEKYLAAKE
jgi:thioredoxin reductase (NADPH)